ncbi:MAG TPA: hypothetical protein VMR75_02985, partial [Candidatus Saccharimonadales bacterium]|nr:hypothetical protein [Candidatus Saccharimonadales bacterium]
MCGIIGYVGNREACPLLVGGLKRMEYRGYDSAGIAVVTDGALKLEKHLGKVEELAAAVDKLQLTATIGIGHTRWATHGRPSIANAHPHVAGRVAIVHNGIIENFAQLKAGLEAQGAKFRSETDSEVLAHLIDRAFTGKRSLAEAVRLSLQQVEGTFGLAVISPAEPQTLVAARRGSPLLVGIGEGELYVASDATAIVGQTNQVVYLEDDEVVVCNPSGYEVFDLARRPHTPPVTTIAVELGEIEKSGYDHF